MPRRAGRRDRLGMRARPRAGRGARAPGAVRHGQPASPAARDRRAPARPAPDGRGASSALLGRLGRHQRPRGRVRLRRKARRRGRGAASTPRSASSATSGTGRWSRGWCCGHARPCAPGPIEVLGEPATTWRRCSSELADRSTRPPRRRSWRGRAPCWTTAGTARSRCSRCGRGRRRGAGRVRRRAAAAGRPGRANRRICPDLATTHSSATSRSPSASQQLVALDPPSSRRRGRAARRRPRALPTWRGASLSYALHSRCMSWSTASVLRSWPSTGA